MPEGKALKVLPPELPKEYREFVACTRDTLEVPPGPLTWAKLPGVPDSLKPKATFEPGEKGAVKVTISAAGLALQVDISVSKHGNLKADTSSWPTDTPFIGDQLKDLAKGVSSWVDDLNADFRKNNKKLGGISVVDGKLTGSKVTLDARTAMADTYGGDQFAASPDQSASSGTGVQLPWPDDATIARLGRGGPSQDPGTGVQLPWPDDATIARLGRGGPSQDPGSGPNVSPWPEHPSFAAGDPIAALPSAGAQHLPPKQGRSWLGQAVGDTIVPDWSTATARAFPRPAAVGAGVGILITGISTAILISGGTTPTGGGPFVLPPIGEPVTITGTLATTDLDFEVVSDIGNEMRITFADTGGLVDGSAQVIYEARSSSGATFTNTSDLTGWVAAYDPTTGRFFGAATHQATGEAQGQTQTRELSPLLLDMAADRATGSLSGRFQGVGFSYPVSGSTSAQLSSANPGNASIGGTFDASAMDRPDATEMVLENRWLTFANEGNLISGVGVLRVNYEFDSDAFGAGCSSEVIRVMSASGEFDSSSGAVTGTSKVLAWATTSQTCTFETGIAAEDATVSGILTTNSGGLQLTINASATVQGPFSVNVQFDPTLFAAPGQAGESDKTLPIAGVVGGAALTLISTSVGLWARRLRNTPPAPPV